MNASLLIWQLPPDLKAKLKRVPGLIGLVRLCRFIGNASYRSEWLLKHESPDNLFQPYGFTLPDRYPRIFTYVCKRLSNIETPRLLSYGCSTGEEVFSLRRYFPLAEIVGIDINSRSIAICKKKLRRHNDKRIRFKLTGSPDTEPASFYDAIFCMAVFRHGDLGIQKVENCDHLIRFADFERTLAALNKCLKPGGYLVIRHSNFRFADTAIATEFDVALNTNTKAPIDATPLYGPDNRRLADTIYNEAIFRKKIK